eukprot:m.462559 g.462559  ORF g.462559 m.462559 type:complete len:100 (-) comp22706_c0_seq1:309-608(-)
MARQCEYRNAVVHGKESNVAESVVVDVVMAPFDGPEDEKPGAPSHNDPTWVPAERLHTQSVGNLTDALAQRRKPNTLHGRHGGTLPDDATRPACLPANY